MSSATCDILPHLCSRRSRRVLLMECLDQVLVLPIVSMYGYCFNRIRHPSMLGSPEYPVVPPTWTSCSSSFGSHHPSNPQTGALINSPDLYEVHSLQLPTLHLIMLTIAIGFPCLSPCGSNSNNDVCKISFGGGEDDFCGLEVVRGSLRNG
ncbi:unnamed protein product [Linum trigynum]|uniref:Uncharacterized protein n=1 Tax=Linum trigynum TaxID=586398 RepID=A0AAV2GS63_9ROSI